MKYFALALLAVCYAGHVTAMNTEHAPADKTYQGTGTIPGDITVQESAHFNKARVTGNANFSNSLKAQDTQFLGSLTVSDAARLKEVSITGKTMIGTALKATRTKFLSDLEVKDAAFLKNSEVKGNAIFGNVALTEQATFLGTVQVADVLSAKSSTFAKTVTVKASDIELTDCTVDTVILKFNGEAGKVPTVHLTNTKVNGTITFEGREGKLIADKSSSFTEKNVSNARIERTA